MSRHNLMMVYHYASYVTVVNVSSFVKSNGQRRFVTIEVFNRLFAATSTRELSPSSIV